ncbi:hypothetical protein MRX96_005233 [Rhipicephalus microplus]
MSNGALCERPAGGISRDRRSGIPSRGERVLLLRNPPAGSLPGGRRGIGPPIPHDAVCLEQDVHSGLFNPVPLRYGVHSSLTRRGAFTAAAQGFREPMFRRPRLSTETPAAGIQSSRGRFPRRMPKAKAAVPRAGSEQRTDHNADHVSCR